MEEAAVPALSARIKRTRMATINPDTGSHFTQAEVAARVGVSLRAYSEWENKIEPSARRLRQIAAALDLPTDHFQPSEDVAAATANLEAETDRLRLIVDDAAALLKVLRAQIEPTRAEPSRRARK